MNKFEFLHQKTFNIKHSKTNFWSHLYGTYKILNEYKKEDYVCDAGLYHAVYNTQSFEANLNISREQVVELIGSRAENLVYIFCKIRGRTKFLLSSENQILIDGTQRVLSDKEKLDILWVEYANILEQSQRKEMKMLAVISERLLINIP